MTERALEVCDRCGWYAHVGPARDMKRCDPAGGATAARIMQAFPEQKSTQLGYGDGNFVIETDPNFHIQFEADGDRGVRLRDVWCLGRLSHDDAVDLTRALVEWRTRRGLAEGERLPKALPSFGSPSSDRVPLVADERSGKGE